MVTVKEWPLLCVVVYICLEMPINAYAVYNSMHESHNLYMFTFGYMYTSDFFHMDAKIDCVQCISQLFGAFMLNSHHQDVSVFLLGDPYTVTLHLSLLGTGPTQ